MTARLIRFSLLVLALGAVGLPRLAEADCSVKQIRKLHEKGMSIDKIADRCEMDKSDVRDAIGDDEEDADSRAADRGPPAAAPRYCCDMFGNSRCVVAIGPNPIGGSCFCPGQGYGVICR